MPIYMCIYVYIYIYMYIYIYIYTYIYIYIYIYLSTSISLSRSVYTRSPSQDSRLFGPRPWKILAATNENSDF